MFLTVLQAKCLETAAVHGWSTLHVLGPASTYSQTRGLSQDGFLPGRNMLHAVNMRVVTKADNTDQGQADKLGTAHLRFWYGQASVKPVTRTVSIFGWSSLSAGRVLYKGIFMVVFC